MIHVSAAIIIQNDKMLICQRAEGGSCSLLWEFPGGKQEPGETPEQCVIRECREELNIKITPLTVYREMSYRYPDREIAFTFFIAEIASGKIQKNVHQELRWVTPSELTQFNFCPADDELVKNLSRTRWIAYRKLVRDRIPEIITQSGQQVVCETLSSDVYLEMLDKKLLEEMKEYQESKSPEELADLVEVIYATAQAHGISIPELERIRCSKAEKRGAFQNKVFLKLVVEDQAQ